MPHSAELGTVEHQLCLRAIDSKVLRINKYSCWGVGTLEQVTALVSLLSLSTGRMLEHCNWVHVYLPPFVFCNFLPPCANSINSKYTHQLCLDFISVSSFKIASLIAAPCVIIMIIVSNECQIRSSVVKIATFCLNFDQMFQSEFENTKERHTEVAQLVRYILLCSVQCAYSMENCRVQIPH